MDQESLVLLIIATELNASNRLKIIEQSNFSTSESHLNALLEFSKTEKTIARLLDKLLGGIIDQYG